MNEIDEARQAINKLNMLLHGEYDHEEFEEEVRAINKLISRCEDLLRNSQE